MKHVAFAVAVASMVLVVACKKSKPKHEPDAAPSAPPSAGPSSAPMATAAATFDVSPRACDAPPPSEATDEQAFARSHDGKSIAWSVTIPSPQKDEPGTAILCFEREGRRKVLLADRDMVDGGVEDMIAGFSGLVFSRDDRVLFFASQNWVVSTGAHGVEVAGGKDFFIVDGAIIEELDRGPYKGSLYATHYRLDDEHPVGHPKYTGRGITYSIVDWHGKTLKKLTGEYEKDRKLLGKE